MAVFDCWPERVFTNCGIQKIMEYKPSKKQKQTAVRCQTLLCNNVCATVILLAASFVCSSRDNSVVIQLFSSAVRNFASDGRLGSRKYVKAPPNMAGTPSSISNHLQLLSPHQ